MSAEESLKLKLKKKIKLGIGKSKKVTGDSGDQSLRKSNKDYSTENQRRKPRNVQLTEGERSERSASSGERNKRTFANKFSKSNKDSTENHWRKERNMQLGEGEKPERRASSDQRNKRIYAKPDRFSKSNNDYSTDNHRRKERNSLLAEGEKPERSASSDQRNKRMYDKPDRFSNSNNDYSTENQWKKERNVRLGKPERSASFGERNKWIYAKSDRFSKNNSYYSTENRWRKERDVQLSEGEMPERLASSDQRNKQTFAKPNKFSKSNKDYSAENHWRNQRSVQLTEGEMPERLGSSGQRNKRIYDRPDGLNSTEKKKQASKLKLRTEKIDGTGTALAHKDTKSRSAELTPFRTPRKRIQDKRAASNDPEVEGEKPKKKKRVIRIDPYDTSNKRLDDGIVANESTKETNKEAKDDNAEMSMNAQFRAIQPSPSILSFVEENLLGRRRMIDIRRAGYDIELPSPLDNAALSTSSERERIEENVFRNKLTFFAAAKVSSSFPPPELPEIAFAGRSNVGKSSLLNSLTRQWGVVRTSDKPGLTQTINFFQLGPKLSLVDLPGYGFAYAKEEVKDAWEELVKEYVSTRVGLKRVCLLIDTKWGMKPRDLELIELMERSQTKYQVVLTKTDLVFPIDVARRAMQIEERLKANKSIVQPLMMVSSKTGAGIGCLRKVLAKVTRFVKV